MSQSRERIYLPPAKRQRLQEKVVNISNEQASFRPESKPDDGVQPSDELVNNESYQRETWEVQKRIIHGTVNRLNCATIKPLVVQVLKTVNLLRMKGVLAKSILQAAMSTASVSTLSSSNPNESYSAVYAAFVAVLHCKLPQFGELVVTRAILQFRRAYRRREKAACIALSIFLGHLFHQGVVHEIVILQLLTILLDGSGGAGPTDDSIEVAVQLLSTTGYALLQVTPAGVRAVTETLRAILHDGTTISKRVCYKIEQLLELRKSGFESAGCCYPSIADSLDLVEADDQITLELSLDDENLEKQDHLDLFSVDPQFVEKERVWQQIKAELLGEGDESSDDEASSVDNDEDDGTASGRNDENIVDNNNSSLVPSSVHDTTKESALVVHQDMSEADLVHLRRTIYLTIMSSATFEECTHKLASIDIPPSSEHELINMLLECCSQERTFLRYYGLVAARFCVLDQRWKQAFESAFVEQYNTIHRLETNKLRNVAKLFAHLLFTDSIPWTVLSFIHLNETETTSSSRIFIKILMQEMAQTMGMAKLKERLQPSKIAEKTPDEIVENTGDNYYTGLFPRDNVRNTRYAINFFTSIGLGPLTDDLREFLKNAPKLILEQQQQQSMVKQGEDMDSDQSFVILLFQFHVVVVIIRL